MPRISPAVERRWLFAISGVLWTAVGAMLMTYAFVWLAPVGLHLEIALGAAGLAIAAIAARYLFRGIARKNIDRIERGPDRASVFSFQPWKSYVLMVGMIALGIALRRSGVPKPALAVVYAAVGGALMLAAGVYHRRAYRDGRDEQDR
jgi:di/tricarboxylate transporter